ncbi:hypothetical protein [Alysiella crassa]|uniref:Chemoreceptor zinc-binding domain-containing protein n=1 Tax=Alysiella crassa TaxID=153491 RepID=A0A376BM84_9NEIS|nr:hypothetical protein [Alysiella crassa]UOP07105.1 hypothetical protein LVJ80_01115 [Alysiella crassa]SSY70745.1 Uncharacterised protein [Alysiella crassa]
MRLFKKWFAQSKRQPENTAINNKDCCNTNELIDFIQKFVTEETLEPAVNAFVNKRQNGGCGCDDYDNMEITVLDNVKSPCPKYSVPELQVLLAGHKAYCYQLEQMMREGQTKTFDLAAVGEGLMCCIGQWLKCEEHTLRDYAEYAELTMAYQHFQECAEKMLENHKNGHLIEAVYTLRGEFVQTSGRVQQALLNLVAAILDEQPALQAV